MQGKRFFTKVLIALLCVVALSACLQAAAGEITLGGEYHKITCNGFVADTFMGVEARYNLNGPTIYCTELIPRFYREVFGVEVGAGGSAPRVKKGDHCRFVEFAEAQPGDVLVATGASRGKSYGHWAICKSVNPDANEMTVFEQNWRWNGSACVGRVIPLRGSCYRAFRLVTDEGDRVPTLAERAELEAAERQAAAEAAILEAMASQPVVQSNQNLLKQAIRTAELIL